MQNFLDFEKPLLEIQSKIEELRHLKDTSENIANELSQLQEKFDKKLSECKTFHFSMPSENFHLWEHFFTPKLTQKKTPRRNRRMSI